MKKTILKHLTGYYKDAMELEVGYLKILSELRAKNNTEAENELTGNCKLKESFYKIHFCNMVSYEVAKSVIETRLQISYETVNNIVLTEVKNLLKIADNYIVHLLKLGVVSVTVEKLNHLADQLTELAGKYLDNTVGQLIKILDYPDLTVSTAGSNSLCDCGSCTDIDV